MIKIISVNVLDESLLFIKCLTFLVAFISSAIQIKMNYMGSVTGVNPTMSEFVVDNKIVVYAAYLFINNPKIQLPLVGKDILIVGGHLYETRHIFLDANSKITGQSNIPNAENKREELLLRLITDFNLKPLDLLKLHDSIELLCSSQFVTKKFVEQTIKLNVSLNATKIILSLVPYLPKTVNSDRSIFSEAVLDNYQIKMPLIYHNRERAERLQNPMHWSLGVYTSEHNDLLIGYLSVHEKLGFITLSDSKNFLPCLIASENSITFSEQIMNCLNNFVVVTKFWVYTETYKNHGLFRYFYFTINDVKQLVLDLPVTKMSLNPKLAHARVVFNFTVVHRATISLKGENLQCWVQVLIHNNESADLECIFRLYNQQIKNWPVLNTNDVYKLMTGNEEFVQQINKVQPFNWYTIEKRRVPVFTIPNDAQFQFVRYEEKFPSNSQLPGVLETVDRMSELKGKLVSFQGVIVKKRFVDPIPGPDTQPSTNRAFGMPGGMVHQLILKDCASAAVDEAELTVLAGSEAELEAEYQRREAQGRAGSRPQLAVVYMHNWRALQQPLALVPGARLALRCLTTHNGRYFKPTFLTTATPIDFQPQYTFSTCPELFGNEDWGPSCNLGNGSLVPIDCLCWGRTESIRFTHLKVTTVCSKCSSRIEPRQASCCSQTMYNLQITAVLTIADASGVATVITKDDEVLRVILEYTKTDWLHWKKAMKLIRFFTLDTSESEPNVATSSGLFAMACLQEVYAFNATGPHNFDLKCRRLDKNAGDRDNTPKWYCVEARTAQ